MKKIVFLEKCLPGLVKAFEDSNFEVSYQTLEELKNTEIHPDYLFSFDFDIQASEWSKKNSIIYISWIFDSPHIPLYCEIAKEPHNRIFVFDRQDYVSFVNEGRTNVFYLPLATDANYFQNIIKRKRINNSKKYSDISFVGNLYDINQFDQLKYLPEYYRGFIDGLIESQTNMWGVDIFASSLITNDFITEIKKYINLQLENNFADNIFNVFLDQMLGRKTAQIERYRICNLLSQKYDFTVYTKSSTSFNSEICNGGYLDYLTQMPLVFNGSKINLNISMHCIKSGIPLRVLDIMACEGFCLSNYQSELADYFEIDKEIVLYSCIEELIEKINYYLRNEKERRRIATAGYEKIRKYFDYSIIVPQMIDML